VVRDGGAAVDLSRFGDVPFLTKDVIRDQFDRLTSRALPPGRRSYANSSGGSTGQPARFLQDNVYWDVNVATKTFHFGWFGKRLGDRELKIWGSEHDLLKESARTSPPGLRLGSTTAARSSASPCPKRASARSWPRSTASGRT
jgi:phenylacetate-CoA ligase